MGVLTAENGEDAEEITQQVGQREGYSYSIGRNLCLPRITQPKKAQTLLFHHLGGTGPHNPLRICTWWTERNVECMLQLQSARSNNRCDPIGLNSESDRQF